jgi:sensor histidine kinase YesM
MREFLKSLISYFIISQLIFASLFLIYGKEILEIEKQLIPFSILAGILLYLADKLLTKIKIAWIMLVAEIVLTSAALIISYHIVYLFTMGEFLMVNIHNENVYLILVSIIVVRILIRYQVIKVGHAIREKDIKISRQNELLVKSQLNAIQARINPHFLYNSLNSLAELSKKDTDKTEKMALSLSELFQYNTNRDNELSISLSKEIDMIRLYLSIEKQRFSDRLDYEIHVEEKLAELLIPKFLLQPLVENAVKHGVSKITGKGIIKINVSQLENKVSIKIFDNGPDFPDGVINGYGLQNTYEKLDLIYQKPYEIRFMNSEEKHMWILLNL